MNRHKDTHKVPMMPYNTLISNQTDEKPSVQTTNLFMETERTKPKMLDFAFSYSCCRTT
jgi:hypothetical protein